jgi:homoserine O-acetyltransferase/O-succinyltransferase
VGATPRPAPELRTTQFGALRLPSGIEIAGLEVAYTLEGRPEPDGSNLILAFHSLTGGPDPAAWWPRLHGEGRLLDPSRWAILAPAFLGSPFGTRVLDHEGRPMPTSSSILGDSPEDASEAVEGGTAVVGPAAGSITEGGATKEGAIGEGPPAGITSRDQAFLVELLLDRLGLARARLALGGSFGGMVALEWAALAPARTDTVVSVAAPARQTAEVLANHHLQREAIRLLPGAAGVALARQVAMTTYRTGEEFEDRFGRRRREDGLPEVASWLEHHGWKLARTFPPAHYRALLETMDRHDVGAGREGGIGGALARFRGRLVGVGIPGDRLYPASEVRRWVDAAQAARRASRFGGPPTEYREIRSIHGHDAFLLEVEQVGVILEDLLNGAPSDRRSS